HRHVGVRERGEPSASCRFPALTSVATTAFACVAVRVARAINKNRRVLHVSPNYSDRSSGPASNRSSTKVVIKREELDVQIDIVL
ncbi:MAG: hypothetical protein ACRDF9_05825, partial [Candidatus Limnocylindria bacterium]